MIKRGKIIGRQPKNSFNISFTSCWFIGSFYSFLSNINTRLSSPNCVGPVHCGCVRKGFCFCPAKFLFWICTFLVLRFSPRSQQFCLPPCFWLLKEKRFHHFSLICLRSSNRLGQNTTTQQTREKTEKLSRLCLYQTGVWKQQQKHVLSTFVDFLSWYT